METSNIVAGSNVFLCRTKYPYYDPEFVKQVQDYTLIKFISSRRQVDNQVAPFLNNQQAILKTEMRCVYAKNDPCWGYKNSKNKVVSACINSECPKLKECNPDYTKEDADYWNTTDEERRLYGRPDRLPRFYIVDMISDEEMNRYVVDPGNDGRDFTTPPAPVYKRPDEVIKKENYRIDPKTGRKKVVIGYKKLQYPFEEDGFGEPIWGFVEDIESEKRSTVIRKAKKIEKKKEVQTVKKSVSSMEFNSDKKVDPDYVNKADYEKAVAEHITEEVKLTDFNAEYILPNDTVILFDNPAELAFVSGTLLVEGIDHGLGKGEGVTLAMIDDYIAYAEKSLVYATNTLLKNGCREDNVQMWKALADRTELRELRISEREYYEFSYDSERRWTCRNMYGVTHVCVTSEDVKEIDKLEDGLYPVLLVDDGDSYMILRKNGNPLGHLGIGFVNLIKALKAQDQIAATPQVIKGISLKVVAGDVEILGMGHLKFIEY